MRRGLNKNAARSEADSGDTFPSTATLCLAKRGPADAIARLPRGRPVALFAADAPYGAPLRCEGVTLALLGTADPAVLRA